MTVDEIMITERMADRAIQQRMKDGLVFLVSKREFKIATSVELFRWFPDPVSVVDTNSPSTVQECSFNHGH